jgi:hypothetical protein
MAGLLLKSPVTDSFPDERSSGVNICHKVLFGKKATKLFAILGIGRCPVILL